MKFYTRTGSIYEVEGNYVRRVSDRGMRRDEEWIRMLQPPYIQVGHSAHMALEPLGSNDVTFRTTSPVERIEQ